MHPITIDQIDERLRRLPPNELAVVFDFVSYLVDRGESAGTSDPDGARLLMAATEPVLGRDWNRAEEDAAWADL